MFDYGVSKDKKSRPFSQKKGTRVPPMFILFYFSLFSCSDFFSNFKQNLRRHSRQKSIHSTKQSNSDVEHEKEDENFLLLDEDFCTQAIKYIEDEHLIPPKIEGTHFYEIPQTRPVRIYCDGVFDIFHLGHVKMLKQAKNFFPNVHLIVGVMSDEDVTKYKRTPVMKYNERVDSVRECQYVDEIFEGAPWQIDLDFLEKHKIDFVSHDQAPYKCGDVKDVYSEIKSAKRFIATRRTRCISTTDTIQRIVENIEEYVKEKSAKKSENISKNGTFPESNPSKTKI